MHERRPEECRLCLGGGGGGGGGGLSSKNWTNMASARVGRTKGKEYHPLHAGQGVSMKIPMTGAGFHKNID